MKRRRRGTGTISRTRDGLYRARFPFSGHGREDIDGSPFPSYNAADRALAALLVTLNDAGAIVGGITLRKLGEKGLAQRELDGYRSVDDERNVWDLRVETWEQASLPASVTTTGDVRAWLAAMRNKKTKKPLAAQTRRNALNLLRSVYAFGIEHELVTENPCEGVKIKDHGTTKETSTFLTLAEVDALVRVSFADEPGVALKIGTGLRSGELRTLHWADVHEHHVTVRFGGMKDGTLQPPKNGKIRDVPILPLARTALARLRERFESETPTGIVLPSVTHYYRARGQVFERDAWKIWLVAAELARRVRPHDLRHTCATLLLQGAWGEPWTLEEVKEMLGHSSVKVTERYAKATGTLAQKAARSKIDRGAEGSQIAAGNAAQARGILERRGWDSNPRMTVLQTQHRPLEFRSLDELAPRLRPFLDSVAEGSPHAVARGLDLAEAVADLLESVAAQTTIGRSA